MFLKSISHFVKQSWLLIVASFCFGLLIAVIDAELKPRIDQNEQDKLNRLMKGLISDAEDFEVVTEEAKIVGGKGKVRLTDIYRASDSAGTTAGFAFVAEGAGFADKIKLVIAIDGGCNKFFGFKVLASRETPGFGSKIKEAFYGEQFRGAPAGDLICIKSGNAEIIDADIVAISGATVSSESVVKIFNTYIDDVKEELKAKELIN